MWFLGRRVMDRAIISAHLKRTPRDPFTHSSLRLDMLQPLPELAASIQEWRLRKESTAFNSSTSMMSMYSFVCDRCSHKCAVAGEAVGVSASALGELVGSDGGDLPVEVMEALIEAEKLNGAAKRAEAAADEATRARKAVRRHHRTHGSVRKLLLFRQSRIGCTT